MIALVYAGHLASCGAAVAVNVLARKRGLPRWAVGAVNAAMAAAAALVLVHVTEPPEWLGDFRKAYYSAGQLVRRDPVAMYAPDRLAFVNLPVVAYCFTPFTHFWIRPARYLFMALGLAVCALAWALLTRAARASGWRALALAGLFVFFGPLYYSLREGNLTHFALLAVAGALLCMETRRDLALGACLAAAGLMKPPLLLLAGCFVLRRRWRVVAGCVVPLLLVTAASVALVGMPAHRAWLDRCIFPYASRPMTEYNVQSLNAVLARLLTPATPEGEWRPVDPGGTFRALHLLLLAAVAGLPVLACLRREGPEAAGTQRLEFCMALCLAVLVSPVSWTHYYLLLLAPAALCLGQRLPLTRWDAWCIAAAMVLMAPPVVDLSAVVGPGRLLVSHYWAGGVLLLGSLSVARWRAGAAPAVVPLARRRAA
jgi:hypothetical protein